MAKKTFNLILRVSGEWKNDLQRICKNKGRTMTGHIEHSLKLAKLVTEFCDGNDDLTHVDRVLRDLNLAPAKASYPETKPSILLAAESHKSGRASGEKKVSYKKK